MIPVLIIIMLLTSACQSSPPSPTTTSKGGSLRTLIFPALPTATLEATKCNSKADMVVLPFEEAIEEADFVAKLSIDHVIKELVYPSHKTLFQASVITVVKGDKDLTTVHVLQAGNSKCSFNENELFLPGEQYYLILNHATQVETENTFYIQGEETGMYKIIEDGYIVKLAYRDSYLSDIDDTSLHNKLRANYDKQIMVFEEQAFVDKINQLIEADN